MNAVFWGRDGSEGHSLSLFFSVSVSLSFSLCVCICVCSTFSTIKYFHSHRSPLRSSEASLVPLYRWPNSVLSKGSDLPKVAQLVSHTTKIEHSKEQKLLSLAGPTLRDDLVSMITEAVCYSTEWLDHRVRMTLVQVSSQTPVRCETKTH